MQRKTAPEQKDSQQLDLLQTLPVELRQHTFTFFHDAQSLAKAALINRECKQFADERWQTLRQELRDEYREKYKEKYKENVFYTFGLPINYRLAGIDLNREIYESFLCNKVSNLKLFETEEETREFLLDSMQSGLLVEAAIFKVLYLGDANVLRRQRPGGVITVDMFDRATLHKCFDGKREKVMPFEGKLMVHHTLAGHIDYDKLPFKPQIPASEQVPVSEKKQPGCSPCCVM